MNTRTKFTVALVLVVFAFASRLLPHEWNFTPLMAMALFAGTYLGLRWSLGIVTVSMLLGDIFLGFYSLPIMAVVYGSFFVGGVLGFLIRPRKNFFTIGAVTLASSTFFFLSTNAAVWFFGTLYPHTLAGLFQSYAMGLPFYRAMLAGDITYVGVLFGVYEAVLYAQRAGWLTRARERIFMLRFIPHLESLGIPRTKESSKRDA